MASSNTVTIDVIADTTSAIKSINTLSRSIINTLAGITATVTTAVVAIGKESLESYADYEQLTQSVALIFDDAADSVIASAQNAYSQMQISANDYLEQATNFGELLVNSLSGDTEGAAEYVEMALTDMADIANAYGLELSTVQDVYKSISHGIYTTLDNLNLGYTQGKTSMEQLIADANEYAESIGEAGDLTIDSFADIVQAIDYIVQKNGIAGTSAREAVETIQGSLNVLSATWENWELSLSTDDLDTSDYTAALIEALENVAVNVLPIIEEIAVGLAESLPQAISDAASVVVPLLVESIAAIWNTASAILSEYTNIDIGTIDASSVKDAMASIGEVFQGLWDVLEPVIIWLVDTAAPAISDFFDSITSTDVSNIAIFSTIAVALKELMDVLPLASGSDVLSGLVSGFKGLSTVLSGNLSTVIPSVSTALSTFTVDGGFAAALSSLASGFSLSSLQGTGLLTAIKGIGSFFTSAAPTILLVVSALGALALAFTNAYESSDTFQEIVDSIPEIVGTALSTAASAIVEYLPQALEALASVLDSLAQYVIENGPEIVAQAVSFLTTVADIFAIYLPSILAAVGEIIGALISYVVAEAPNLLAAAVTLMFAFIDGIGQMAGGIIAGFIEGIGEFAACVWEWFEEQLNNLIDWIKGLLGINSPSTVFAEMGNDIIQGLLDGLNELIENVTGFFGDLVEDITGAIEDPGELLVSTGKSIIDGLWSGLKSTWKSVKEWVGGIATWIEENKGPIEYDAKLLVPAGEAIMKGLYNGLEDGFSDVEALMGDVTDSFGTFTADATVDMTLSGVNLQGIDSSASTTALGTTINQTFETKVVRSDSDLYTAAPIIYRNAMREASLA